MSPPIFLIMQTELAMFINGSLIIGRMGPDGDGEIVRMGKCLDDNLKWNDIKKEFASRNYGHTFICEACQEPVFVVALPAAAYFQGCRCTIVQHLITDSGPCFNPDGWIRFQEQFRQESLRPVPSDGLKKDPITGQYCGFNGRGKKWIRERLGLTDSVKLSDDTKTFSIGGSSLTSTPEGNLFLAGEDPAEVQELANNLYAHRKATGAGPNDIPPRVVVLGVDPDYVWPSETIKSRISSVPFCCPTCQARVKRAPVRFEVNVDEIFQCFCMSVFFRRDTERPQSSGDWGDIRLQEKEMQVRMRAVTSDSKS
jgi:hypothetical protein